ncbi:hypothetical protein TELCIR_15459, partial [Teladorsagia circumcincta]
MSSNQRTEEEASQKCRDQPNIELSPQMIPIIRLWLPLTPIVLVKIRRRGRLSRISKEDLRLT